jgi:hypothetical protein
MGVNGRIILKERRWKEAYWIDLDHNRDQWGAILKM